MSDDSVTVRLSKDQALALGGVLALPQNESSDPTVSSTINAVLAQIEEQTSS